VRGRTLDVPVYDPFGVTADPTMPSLVPALDPEEAQRQFDERLRHLADPGGSLTLRKIRVSRYKPEKRCVVEYDLEAARPGASPEPFTLLGKVRAGRFGKSGYRLLRALWEADFRSDAPDGVVVPEPVGTVSRFRMWLQRKAPGRVATELLAGPGGPDLARRISEAAHKVHAAGVPTERRHTMADELRILHERLPRVADDEPRRARRVDRLLAACDRLGAAVPEPAPRGIHRDFYGDQVLVDGGRLCLIDFDLYCEGDPALDVGNFAGHVTEHALRALGDPEALADVERAMEDRFVELSGECEATRFAVRAYATLTLVRHVHLSTLFPERRPFTGDLLNLCEERLGERC
jgi:hypothetical protein